jgi:hypothetical protein
MFKIKKVRDLKQVIQSMKLSGTAKNGKAMYNECHHMLRCVTQNRPRGWRCKGRPRRDERTNRNFDSKRGITYQNLGKKKKKKKKRSMLPPSSPWRWRQHGPLKRWYLPITHVLRYFFMAWCYVKHKDNLTFSLHLVTQVWVFYGANVTCAWCEYV